MARNLFDSLTARAALAALFLPLAVAPGCATSQPAPQARTGPESGGPSLYDRLGGVNAMALLMDDVIERSYADPLFNANPRIVEAHQRYPKAAYKFHATALACMATGGPCRYVGRTVKDAHQRLEVTEAEWARLIVIFRESMTGFKVPAREQEEIVAILEAAKGDVVVPAARSASR